MSDPVSAKKEKLRQFFLNTRLKLSQNSVQEKSEKILEKVTESIEFKKAKAIHTYIPIKKNNEVDTLPFVKACFESNKEVIVPKVAGDGLLNHIKISSADDLQLNNWGIPEPSVNTLFPILDINLVIVPMVAGDYFKNRLGYGKGYYDRFLYKCPAIKIGLLFDCQIYNKKLPAESFDIPLDILVTESTRIE